MVMVKVGVVHGRFQIFHNDHLRYVLAALEESERLIIGISNPDISMIREEKEDEKRSKKEANPLTYYERYLMIKKVLEVEGVDMTRIDIVPFPINYPERILSYTPKEARYFITIYDDWGSEKKNKLESLGLDVKVLWQRDECDKGITATSLRENIASGKDDWKNDVPIGAIEYIYSSGALQKIRNALKEK